MTAIPPDDIDDPAVLHERELVLSAASGGKLDTIQERVAWLLNNYPETRNSDIALQIRYWSRFQSDQLEGEYLHVDQLYRLARLTSLTRARAKIQNTYKLFQADGEVARFRGQLDADRRQEQREQRVDHPMYTVYMDESGKTDRQVIVGSVWFLHAPEIFALHQAIEATKAAHNYSGELHFATISDRHLPMYRQVADCVAERANTVSFKALTVERAGLGNVNQALEDLFYHLLVRGIEHEDRTGRAPLPRRLMVSKDAEEVGRDRLMLANIADRLTQASAAQFEDRLFVAEPVAIDSRGNLLMQLADLFTSALNRVVNVNPGGGTHAKDAFANHLLTHLQIPGGPQDTDAVGDIAVLLSL